MLRLLKSAHPLPQELSDQIIADTGPWLMGLPEAQHHRHERAKDEVVVVRRIERRLRIALYALWATLATVAIDKTSLTGGLILRRPSHTGNSDPAPISKSKLML
jgi:hypothetical protein